MLSTVTCLVWSRWSISWSLAERERVEKRPYLKHLILLAVDLTSGYHQVSFALCDPRLGTAAMVDLLWSMPHSSLLSCFHNHRRLRVRLPTRFRSCLRHSVPLAFCSDIDELTKLDVPSRLLRASLFISPTVDSCTCRSVLLSVSVAATTQLLYLIATCGIRS